MKFRNKQINYLNIEFQPSSFGALAHHHQTCQENFKLEMSEIAK